MELRPRSTGKPAMVASGVAAVVLLAVACSLKKAGPPSDAPAAPAQLLPGFVNHQDPAGFTVQRPEDWRVTAPSLGEISIASPNGGSAAWIRARVVPGDLPRYLAENYLGSEAGIGNARTLDVSSDGPNVARGMFEFRVNNLTKRVSVVAVRQGEIATLFAAMAPAESFAAELPRLTRILESFRFVPPDSGGAGRSRRAPSTPAMQFVQWVDPNEQAFSFEVPAGWQPQGGLLRRGDGVRVAWQITAPDGAAFLFGGDQTVPSYFVFPTQIALSLGNREGYPTGPGGPIMLRFQEAPSMGQTLLQQRFGQVQVTATRPRPDLLEVIRRSPVLAGSLSRMSAAELEFKLSDGRIGRSC